MSELKFYRNPDGISKTKIEMRNGLIVKFFRQILNTNLILIGDAEKPEFVIDYDYQISAYAKNFEIIFLDKFDNGTPIYKVNLDDYSIIDGNWFNAKLMPQLETKKLWKIKLNISDDGIPFYLCGFNYENEKRFPVFASKKPKVFHTENFAEKMAGELKSESYDVSITR